MEIGHRSICGTFRGAEAEWPLACSDKKKPESVGERQGFGGEFLT